MKDLCNALIKGALNSECVNDVYNIGGANDMSLYEMASAIGKIYNVGVKFIEWPESSLKVESGDTIFDSAKFDRKNKFSYNQNFNKWIKEEQNI